MNFEQVNAHYDATHLDIYASGILPKGRIRPGWEVPAGREALGPR